MKSTGEVKKPFHSDQTGLKTMEQKHLEECPSALVLEEFQLHHYKDTQI